MSNTDLGIISINPRKLTTIIPKKKRCSVCKKRAKSRIRPRNLDTNEPLDKWTYYCNRHYKQVVKTLQNQIPNHNKSILNNYYKSDKE
jgi:hypothetical protein